MKKKDGKERRRDDDRKRGGEMIIDSEREKVRGTKVEVVVDIHDQF